jgi:hypothetical protein
MVLLKLIDQVNWVLALMNQDKQQVVHDVDALSKEIAVDVDL